MEKCEACGNEYAQTFQVVMNGASHHFDSFECAIHALAPSCAHCGMRIIGHGLEAGNARYCCANCARASGIRELRDHG